MNETSASSFWNLPMQKKQKQKQNSRTWSTQLDVFQPAEGRVQVGSSAMNCQTESNWSLFSSHMFYLNKKYQCST